MSIEHEFFRLGCAPGVCMRSARHLRVTGGLPSVHLVGIGEAVVILFRADNEVVQHGDVE